MTSVPASLLFCAAWGALLGFVYFGGLWLTVRRLPHSPRPTRLWTLSFALRLAALLAGVWPLLQQARVTPLAPFVGMAGILLVRLLLARLLGPRRQMKSPEQTQGVDA